MSDFRTTYVALIHAGLAVDVLVENDALVGRLRYYDVLYVLSTPQITGACARAIAAWVAAGGTVVSTGGGGMLDEYNRTNVEFQKLFGVNQTAMYSGNQTYFNKTVFWEKQDLPYVELLDTVQVLDSVKSPPTGPRPLAVKGHKAVFSINASDDYIDTLATFVSDGAPAVTRRRVGAGWAVYAGFYPGLAYFDPAIPRLPVCRGSIDESFNHWTPTEFNTAAKFLLATVVDDPA